MYKQYECVYCIDRIVSDVYQKQWLITVNDNLIENEKKEKKPKPTTIAVATTNQTSYTNVVDQ